MEEPRIDGGFVRALFHEHEILKPGTKGTVWPPSNAGFDALAGTLIGLRMFHQHRIGPFRQQLGWHATFREAISTLDQVIPPMIENFRDLGHPDLVEIMQQLQSLHAQVKKNPVVYTPPAILKHLHDEYDDWHAYALALGEKFREVMREYNPTTAFSYSHDGPVTRFVAASMPTITGECPTTPAIAAFARRCQARFRAGRVEH